MRTPVHTRIKACQGRPNPAIWVFLGVRIHQGVLKHGNRQHGPSNPANPYMPLSPSAWIRGCGIGWRFSSGFTSGPDWFMSGLILDGYAGGMVDFTFLHSTQHDGMSTPAPKAPVRPGDFLLGPHAHSCQVR